MMNIDDPPGPDFKEHVAITIFATATLAISIFATDDFYHNIQVIVWEQLEVIPP
jgi:hypothetical protein